MHAWGKQMTFYFIHLSIFIYCKDQRASYLTSQGREPPGDNVTKFFNEVCVLHKKWINGRKKKEKNTSFVLVGLLYTRRLH